VITFFPEVVEKVKSEHDAMVMCNLDTTPLYQIHYRGQKVGFYLSAIGAPLAVRYLEQAIAYGYTKFVACGGASQQTCNKLV